ncbi:L-aspartate oxidase [Labrys wisconsinensis]|uniref:L-aspartate oxidase n=1 Tax=Labrys wisconsinensis TaxID=425677 RepID=A0ABU0IZV1_9HYPH|nr:L-aspartate oxidase [Labrys wisconsinensis]MDQ0467547.1 L-aspartate oxidase [Labrys wisconsinensis]
MTRLLSASELSGRPVIVGGGLAGLMTALRLAPEPVVVLAKAPLGAEASSAWAQGGLAASLGPDDDPGLHLADTLAAGDGLCDAEVAGRIVRAAPAAIEALARLGAAFDRDDDGRLRLGLEAAHSRHRIVHAAGDGTGREVMRALAAAVRRTPSILVLEGLEARRLLLKDGAIAGVAAAGPAGALALATRRVVLATGGVGGLFQDSTNPAGSFGQGLALAARAGAVLADLEFVQFHPTALDGPARPMALVSEAVRGEGAVLVDETGRRFLADMPGAELATRDAVARGVWRHLAAGHRVFLDARQRPGADFAERFPAISVLCRAAGFDPATQPVPIRPAAHYHMGGVAVDDEGRSSVAGLWACGEVACTGLHGANRLASNSLIEAAVSAGWVADSVAGTAAGGAAPLAPPAPPPAPDPAAVRPTLSRHLGVLREAAGLEAALATLLPLAAGDGPAGDPAAVGLMIAVAALRRTESRGAHHRTDFPCRAAEPRRIRLRLDEALAAARVFDRPQPLARSA